MEMLGQFDAVWDRATFSFLPEADHSKYASIIERMFRPHFRCLMTVVMYRPPEKYEGPPNNIPNHVIHQHFGDRATWKQIDYEEWMSEDQLKKNGLNLFRENLLLLTARGL